MRKIILWLVFIFLVGCSSDKQEQERLPDIIYLLKQEVNPIFLQYKISESILNEKTEEARTYQAIAKLINIDLDDAEINKQIAEQDSGFAKYLRTAKRASKGFIFGSADNLEEFSGAVLSDMLIVGDIRDFSKETINYVQDKNVDYFTYGLSALGIGASVASVASLGGTAPAAGGISFLKIARKTGKLSSELLGSVTKLVKKSIDFKLLKKELKKIDVKDFYTLKKQLKGSFKASTDLKRLVKVTNNINDIKKSTGSYGAALNVIKYADTTSELRSLTQLSRKFGKNTLGILKILGKRAIKTISGLMEIIYYIVAFLYWAVKCLIWFFSIILLGKGGFGMLASVSLVGLSYQFLSFGMVYSLFF